ncbi:hypothetical protein RvY_01216 [Ramazzottius varieornatus]|uniref:Exuperantia SAM-like domain-containing protein n=1 Tax=Ramazzottius varieornatus TaxID=947166 RepID=A0A1D1UQ93_RAMVA|nr:hypothetical protein RvY_01216 [Ramazzottius varieornatus]
MMMYSLVYRCNVAVVCLALVAHSVHAQSTTQRLPVGNSSGSSLPETAKRFVNDTKNAILSPFVNNNTAANNSQATSASGNGSSVPQAGSVQPGAATTPVPPPSINISPRSTGGVQPGVATPFPSTYVPISGSANGPSSLRPGPPPPGAASLPPGVPPMPAGPVSTISKSTVVQTTPQQTNPTTYPSRSTDRTTDHTTVQTTTRTTERTTERTTTPRTTKRTTERPTTRTTERPTTPMMTTTKKTAPLTTSRPGSAPNKQPSKIRNPGKQGLFKEIIKNQTLIAELGQLYQTKGISAVAERLAKRFPAASKFLSSLKGKNTGQILLELMGDADDTSNSIQPKKPMSDKEKNAAYEKIRAGLKNLQSGLNDLTHTGDSSSASRPTSGGSQQLSLDNKMVPNPPPMRTDSPSQKFTGASPSAGLSSSIKNKASSVVDDTKSSIGMKSSPKRQYEEDMEEARHKNKKHKKMDRQHRKKISRQDSSNGDMDSGYDSYYDDNSTDDDWWWGSGSNHWGDEYWYDDSFLDDYSNDHGDYDYYWNDDDWINWYYGEDGYSDADYYYDYDSSRQASQKEPQASNQITA